MTNQRIDQEEWAMERQRMLDREDDLIRQIDEHNTRQREYRAERGLLHERCRILEQERDDAIAMLARQRDDALRRLERERREHAHERRIVERERDYALRAADIVRLNNARAQDDEERRHREIERNWDDVVHDLRTELAEATQTATDLRYERDQAVYNLQNMTRERDGVHEDLGWVPRPRDLTTTRDESSTMTPGQLMQTSVGTLLDSNLRIRPSSSQQIDLSTTMDELSDIHVPRQLSLREVTETEDNSSN